MCIRDRETGAGKTTAGLAVLGLIPSPPGVIVSGEILLNGKDLRALTDKEMDQIRGDAVAMIFQDPMTSLNPVMTVGDQIAEAINCLLYTSSRKLPVWRTFSWALIWRKNHLMMSMSARPLITELIGRMSLQLR